MKRVISLVLVSLLLWVPSVAAAEEFVLHYIPEGARVTVNGKTYQAFTFEEYKALIRLDLELYSNKEIIRTLEEALGNETQTSAKLQELANSMVTTNFNLGVELQRSYAETDSWMKRAANAELPKVWPWVVSMVGAGLALFGVGMIVSVSMDR